MLYLKTVFFTTILLLFILLSKYTIFDLLGIIIITLKFAVIILLILIATV